MLQQKDQLKEINTLKAKTIILTTLDLLPQLVAVKQDLEALKKLNLLIIMDLTITVKKL